MEETIDLNTTINEKDKIIRENEKKISDLLSGCEEQATEVEALKRNNTEMAKRAHQLPKLKIKY